MSTELDEDAVVVDDDEIVEIVVRENEIGAVVAE